MSTTPYARLLVSLNGGAAAAGGIEAAASDDVDFVYESTIGWPSSPAPYLEIYEAPVGWSPVPSTGWVATDGGGWKYYGTTPPPTIAAPDAAHFGKVACQLVVGGGLKDGVLSADMTSGATVLVRSASVGLESVAHRETTEFDEVRAWVGAVQRDLRLLETSLAAVGALTEAQLRAVSATLTAALPVNSKKITGLAAGAAPGEAVEFSQIAAAINSAVSGTTNTLPKIVSANTLGDSGITDDGTTVNTTEAVTITKSGIATTPTRGVTIINATNSSTQWGAQFGWSAINGGAQLNAGFQFEPQSSSRFIVRCAYLVGGSGVPNSSGPYWDLSDPNLGNGWFSDVFGVKSGGAGLRFLNASNRGGWDQDGSSNNRGKSYSGAGFVYEMYSDAGSTLVATPISLAGTGKGRFVATPHVVTSSSGAVTFPLATSQNIRHTTTESTTVTITGAVPGMIGVIDVLQGASGKVVTMPINGSGIEYDTTILLLNGGVNYQDYVIDQTANTRTLLTYYVTDAPVTRLVITSRFVHVLP